MSIVLIFLLVVVLLLVLLNTKRWAGLARGARAARKGLEEEIKPGED